MNMKGKQLLVCMLTCMILLFGSLTAFAEDTYVKIAIPTADKATFQNEVWKEINADGSGDALKVDLKDAKSKVESTTLFKYSDGVITFNQSAFDGATDKSKKKVMHTFVTKLQDSDVSEQTQQNVFNKLSDSNSDVSVLLIPMVMDSTKADIYTAMKWIAPFLQIVRVVFGVGAVLLILILVASTIVDLAFIGLPMARENLESKGDSKGGKIPFVSADAISTVKETESSVDSGGKYKNIYFVYLKRRWLTYVILSIAILYLVVGELGGLIAWVLQLVSGIV